MKLVKFLTTVNHDNEEYQINEIVDIEDNAVISINEAQFNGLVKVKAIRLLTDEETEFHTFKESPKEILLKNDQLDQKENDTCGTHVAHVRTLDGQPNMPVIDGHKKPYQ